MDDMNENFNRAGRLTLEEYDSDETFCDLDDNNTKRNEVDCFFVQSHICQEYINEHEINSLEKISLANEEIVDHKHINNHKRDLLLSEISFLDELNLSLENTNICDPLRSDRPLNKNEKCNETNSEMDPMVCTNSLGGLSEELRNIFEVGDFVGNHYVDDVTDNNTATVKNCSPPLTLIQKPNMNFKPAAKVLPKAKKENKVSIKKILPPRKCKSGYKNVKGKRLIKEKTPISIKGHFYLIL